MKFQRIQYRELNSRQQEAYNFHKVAAVLADYGFVCMKLSDDWQGADFLAYHKDADDTLKVQLKSRLTIDRKYVGKGLYLAFPLARGWCLVEHDELLEIVKGATGWLATESWLVRGLYHSDRPSRTLLRALEPFLLIPEQVGGTDGGQE